MHVSIPPVLLLSLLWLLPGCMSQSVREDPEPTTTAETPHTDPAPEAPVRPLPAKPNRPNEALVVPEYRTATATAPPPRTATPAVTGKRDTGTESKPKPARPARTIAAPPTELPDRKTDEKPATDSSGDNSLAMASPAGTLPDTAPAEAQAAIPRADIMHLDLESLPLSFGAQWILDRRPNPVTKKTQCILTSHAVNIPDGYDRTDVQVLLTLDSIYVNTESNIDLSYPQTGIRIGAGALRPFDELARETTAVVSGDDVATLYGRMTRSPDMVVRLGFWPTWPVTETREANYSLEDIQTAIVALRACNRM